MPVILVVYDARADQAWWLCLQEALREQRQQLKASLTVHVPLDHVLNEAAIRHCAGLRDRVRRGV